MTAKDVVHAVLKGLRLALIFFDVNHGRGWLLYAVGTLIVNPLYEKAQLFNSAGKRVATLIAAMIWFRVTRVWTVTCNNPLCSI